MFAAMLVQHILLPDKPLHTDITNDTTNKTKILLNLHIQINNMKLNEFQYKSFTDATLLQLASW